jgi:Flp pilus assembly pilin Flp
MHTNRNESLDNTNACRRTEVEESVITARSYLRDESGQSATEYILIIGVIVIPLAVAFNELADVLKETLNRIARLLYGPGV